MTEQVELIIDPCNPNFAIDQKGSLCKRVLIKEGGTPPVDLGYVQAPKTEENR